MNSFILFNTGAAIGMGKVYVTVSRRGQTGKSKHAPGAGSLGSMIKHNISKVLVAISVLASLV